MSELDAVAWPYERTVKRPATIMSTARSVKGINRRTRSSVELVLSASGNESCRLFRDVHNATRDHVSSRRASSLRKRGGTRQQ